MKLKLILKKFLFFFKATAGVRSLSIEKQEKILNKVKEEIKGSKFLYLDDFSVKIISGKEEGLFGWIGINFIKNNLYNNVKDKNEIKETIGTMDLGGSSLEITFVTEEKKLTAEIMNLNLFNTDYNLYSTCFEGFGYKSIYHNIFNELISLTNEKNISNPCLLRGFTENYTYNNIEYSFYGTGKFEECEKLAKKQIVKSDCLYQHCSLKGVYQPLIKYDQPFFSISGFTDLAMISGFEMEKFYPTKDFYNKTIEFCKYTWEEAKNLRPEIELEDLKLGCFIGNYIYYLIIDGFNIDENSVNLMFGKYVNNTKISSWSFGAMIYELLNIKY